MRVLRRERIREAAAFGASALDASLPFDELALIAENARSPGFPALAEPRAHVIHFCGRCHTCSRSCRRRRLCCCAWFSPAVSGAGGGVLSRVRQT